MLEFKWEIRNPAIPINLSTSQENKNDFKSPGPLT